MCCLVGESLRIRMPWDSSPKNAPSFGEGYFTFSMHPTSKSKITFICRIDLSGLFKCRSWMNELMFNDVFSDLNHLPTISLGEGLNWLNKSTASCRGQFQLSVTLPRRFQSSKIPFVFLTMTSLKDSDQALQCFIVFCTLPIKSMYGIFTYMKTIKIKHM